MEWTQPLPSWMSLPSPSGFETRLQETLKARWEASGLSVHQDALGNLWVHRGPEDAELHWMLVAPLDEPGLVVTHVDEDTGLARVVPLQPEIGPFSRVPALVRSLEGEPGVLRWPPTMSPSEVHWAQVVLELWEGRPYPGQILYWDTPGRFHPQGQPTSLIGRGLHRSLAVLLVELARAFQPHRARVTFVLAVREQVSTRGAVLVASMQTPQAVLYLKTVPAQEPEGPGDLPSSGQGPVLVVREPGWIAHPQMLTWLETLAPAQYQRAILATGPRPSHEIPFVTPGGLAFAVLALACRGWQTPYETLSVADLKALEAWLHRALQALDETPPSWIQNVKGAIHGHSLGLGA